MTDDELKISETREAMIELEDGFLAASSDSTTIDFANGASSVSWEPHEIPELVQALLYLKAWREKHDD